MTRTVLLALLAVPCGDLHAESLPKPDPIPAALSVEQREKMVSRRNKVEVWRKYLERRIGLHNTTYGRVHTDDTARARAAKESEEKLNKEKGDYGRALMAFNRTLAAAKAQAYLNSTQLKGLVPVPAIPRGLSEKFQKRLDKRRLHLLEWEKDLQSRMARFEKNRAGINTRYAQEQESRIDAELGYYKRALLYLEEDVDFSGVMTEIEDDSFFDEDLVAFAAERRRQFPMNLGQPLANPLDTKQEKADKELLKPLDFFALRSTSSSEVTDIIDKRRAARRREAGRNASRAMNAATKKLEATLAPGETLLAKERWDPEFRRRLRAATQAVADRESAELRRAEDLAMAEHGEFGRLRAKEADPIQVRYLLAQEDHIMFRRDAAVRKAGLRRISDIAAEMDLLEKKGYYREGDDLAQKDREDPRFRAAVDTAMQRVSQKQQRAEQKAQKEAMNRLRELYQEFYLP